MIINIHNNSYLAFDLDDTLYKELDFLRSAYRSIALMLDKTGSEKLYQIMIGLFNNGQNVFEYLIENYENLTLNILLEKYRNHIPSIELLSGLRHIFAQLNKKNIKYGVITDGRSITQRNKLTALGIIKNLSDIIISEELGTEKPAVVNFKTIERKYPEYSFSYFGDNLNKDFFSPNLLGWSTYCLLDNGENIHHQNFNSVNKDYMPDFSFKYWGQVEFKFTE